MKKSSIGDLVARAQKNDAYWVENVILEFTENVVERMEQLEVGKSDLAKKLGKKPSVITKLLRGNNNFTLETMVKLARVLNSQLRVHLQPEGSIAEWVNFPAQKSLQSVMPPSPEWGSMKGKKITMRQDCDSKTHQAPYEQLALAA